MPRVLRPQGSGPFVFLCDHASNHIPEELQSLGLSEADRSRHIAWDIGAAGVTEVLSEIFDAPAILCETSRLVIDCNRQLHRADLIPAVSDDTVIPGNRDLSATDRTARIDRWFQPYHNAIETIIQQREATGQPTVAVSIHSMTDLLAGVKRPWQISLSSGQDRRLTDPVLAKLRTQTDIVVGDNQPYNMDPEFDYSIPLHALRRGLLHLQVEFRQDEIRDKGSQQHWAKRFARALV